MQTPQYGRTSGGMHESLEPAIFGWPSSMVGGQRVRCQQNPLRYRSIYYGGVEWMIAHNFKILFA